MALYSVRYAYGADLEKRLSFRAEHRTFLKTLYEQGIILACGPFTDDADPGGQLLIRADSAATALELLGGDPYLANQVVDEVEVREWTTVYSLWD
ncbi:YciI family protein [Crystallibacter degradans]|uniref:YciI family protein n=1 Tax=Crystallibacter degradans TaxID=2726743 RepID=UPI001473AA90|nr:YciI family protein [Arthrobacter sp. SF27]NMR30534.1 hypothetical protein [Arthrobacter sp. SF27]